MRQTTISAAVLWWVVLSSPLSGESLAASPIALRAVATGLDYPVSIANAGDGSGRLFIVLQQGKVAIHDGSQLLAEPFLDISTLVSCCGEQGLMDIAFHPSYVTNGFFYVNYTDTSGNTVIARYSVSADPDRADHASALVVMTIAQPFENHNGGQLRFGPDGFLYIVTGDGGGAGDPLDNAQNPQSLLGKILRIDPEGGAPYAVPLDNPFTDDPSTLDEIWALGLRNPWRFSFDRLRGDMFISDVGQDSREEVNYQASTSPGGENYGWKVMEGSLCFDPPTVCSSESLTLPIIEYSHDKGCSVTGGHLYRGRQMTQLLGTYLYGDFCTGSIRGARSDGEGIWTSDELLDTELMISTFGEDEAGELYLSHFSPTDGAVFRIVSRAVCDIRMSKTAYNVGDDITFTTFNILNQGTTALPLELKVWVTMPGVPPISVANAGADGSFVLPPDFLWDVGTGSLGSVQELSPRGIYEFGCRLLDPATGQLLAEDVNFFEIP